MTFNSFGSAHWTDEQLIASLYGVGPENGHLGGCEECKSRRSLLLANRNNSEAIGSLDPEVSFEYLAAQRRAICEKLEVRSAWPSMPGLRRWVSVAVTLLVLGGGAAVYQEHHARQSAAPGFRCATGSRSQPNVPGMAGATGGASAGIVRVSAMFTCFRCLAVFTVGGLLACSAAFAQNRANFPWWNSPVVTDLGLSQTQTQKIRQIVRSYRPRLLDARNNVQKAEGDLEDLLNDPDSVAEGSDSIIKRVADARAVSARVFLEMSFQLRRVLTTDQWRQLIKRWDEVQRKRPSETQVPPE